ncbi:hypothetical protein AVEN_275585-1 [Araneus ventricosus]|uniref:Uncharacterized protein n=1 Tax=Araneus ventricosus TaxID=182803 RepID=A0A4Y2KE08_ARAVE|nr:hypothetical protein AVEN_275585-1 [Araneus ventricosus]
MGNYFKNEIFAVLRHGRHHHLRAEWAPHPDHRGRIGPRRVEEGRGDVVRLEDPQGHPLRHLPHSVRPPDGDSLQAVLHLPHRDEDGRHSTHSLQGARGHLLQRQSVSSNVIVNPPAVRLSDCEV